MGADSAVVIALRGGKDPDVSHAPLSRCAGHTVTVVSTAQLGDQTSPLNRWWTPIAHAWPTFAATPRAQLVSLEQAIDATAEILGSAVLIVANEQSDPELIFRLVDRLWENCAGAVVLVPALDDAHARLGGRGVIVMEAAESPAVIAATLNALAEQSSTIDSLQTELRVSRRFQGGLSGEMNKIHDELQLAASVQRELLPATLPVVPNVEFHALFRPASYVSGDIYDVQKLDEHHIGFFIADAVGHGVPAALMTMILARSLTMKDSREASSFLAPSEVLERLNIDMIQRHAEVPRFATAVYGVIDCRDRSVVIAGAGHPRPLRIRGGSISQVETDGGLLGVFPEDKFEEVRFTLEPDEMLVLFSDGFETAFPDTKADEFGRRLPTRRFVEAFDGMARVWRERGGAAAINELVRDLDAQCGSLHQIDDLTALVVLPSVERELDKLFRGEISQSDRIAPIPTPIEQPAGIRT